MTLKKALLHCILAGFYLIFIFVFNLSVVDHAWLDFYKQANIYIIKSLSKT